MGVNKGGRPKCDVPKKNITIRYDTSKILLLIGLKIDLQNEARNFFDALVKSSLEAERTRIQSITNQVEKLQQDQSAREQALSDLMYGFVEKAKNETIQKALNEKQNDQLLSEYHTFCELKNLREKDVADYLINGDQTRLIGPDVENELSNHFKRQGLPDDLNRIRPLIIKTTRKK
jgi:hypothetical protein